MTKPVFLHAGAHRTGTTLFQMCLALNRKSLAQAGYDAAYPGRDDLPGAMLRLDLSAEAGRRHRPMNSMRRISADPDRAIIVSEENAFPARCSSFSGDGSIRTRKTG